MYSVIPAKEQDMEQILHLLLNTDYFEAFAKYNSLNLEPLEFIKEYIVKPALPLTYILIRNKVPEKILGMISCGTHEQIKRLPKPERYFPRKLINIIRPLLEYKPPKGFHIHDLAISPAARGKKLGQLLLEFAENKMHTAGCETLSLTTWCCQTSAIKLYFKAGMIITDLITISDKFPYNVLLCFEKNKNPHVKNIIEIERYLALHLPIRRSNYFESDHYANLDLLHEP